MTLGTDLNCLSVAGDTKHLVSCQAQADLHIRPPAMAPPVVLTDVAYLYAQKQ